MGFETINVSGFETINVSPLGDPNQGMKGITLDQDPSTLH